MWSSNPTTTAAKSTVSDNKEREEVDDCKCSNAAGDAAEKQQQQQQQQQPPQQQLNVFENNSKKPTSSFSGNLTPQQQQQQQPEGHHYAKKEFEATAETSDSGFFSGPQNTTELEPEPEPGQQTPEPEAAKYNILAGRVANDQQQSQQQHQQQPKEEQQFVSDSGYIDVEYDCDDLHDETRSPVSTEQQQQQQQPQVHNELSKPTVAAQSSSSATTTPSSASSTPTSHSGQMIIKNNDDYVSDIFNNLSLQSAVPGWNNLNAAAATSTMTSANSEPAMAVVGSNPRRINKNKPQEQFEQHFDTFNASSNTAAPAAAAVPPQTATTNLPWEQFYQQNDDGDTALHLSCIFGNHDVVVALIRMAPHPCLFNIQNDEAQSPLHLAALTAQPKILRMLVIAGAEPTLRDRHGNTALHLACISGDIQSVRALIMPISASEIHEAHRHFGHRSNDKSYLSFANLPSDLEIRNYDGERCVHLAAQAGHIEILRILVLYGADINAREGKSGRTPLHIAIESCNEELTSLLLDECQNLKIETATYAGLTAYQVACILNKSQMQNILEKRGAIPLTPPDSDYDSSDIETDLDDSKMYDRFGDPGYFANYNGFNPMTVA